MKTIKLLEQVEYLGRLRRKGEFLTVPNSWNLAKHKVIKQDG